MINIIFGLTALLIIIVDQVTKYIVSSHLALNQSTWEMGFFRIQLVHNSGAAFGMFQNGLLPLIVIRIVGAIVVICLFAFMGKRIKAWGGTLAIVALGLVLGGTIGNLIDAIRLGYVVDFLAFNYWPNFNVSDSSVVIAAFIFAFLLLRMARSQSSKPEQPEQ